MRPLKYAALLLTALIRFCASSRVTNSRFSQEKKYELVNRNGKKTEEYSKIYAWTYNNSLKGMVERRMRSAILETGSFRYSAWVDAGQPDLNKLIDKPLSPQERKKMQREAALYRMGKILESK